MLIDLHTHTLHLSLDSGLTLDELARSARSRGLDGICLTEHNALWDPAATRDASARHAIAILHGAEVDTEIGHVLVFNVATLERATWSVSRLRESVDAQGGAMVLAHPWRHLDRRERPGWIAGEWFDAIETVNGREESTSAAAWAGRMLPRTAGSDAHSAGEVGWCATRFDVAVRSDEELAEEIRRGRITPFRLDRARDLAPGQVITGT